MNTTSNQTSNPSSLPYRLGHFVVTPGVVERIALKDSKRAITLHHLRYWGLENRNTYGDMPEHDNPLLSLSHQRNGDRLLSVYQDRNGTRFWIITEADRSVTTILLPDEY